MIAGRVIRLAWIEPFECDNNLHLIERFARLMRIRHHFPPVMVERLYGGRWRYRLHDGFHRVLATRCAGRTTIAANVFIDRRQ